MKVNIIYEPNPDNLAFNIIAEELLKIKGITIWNGIREQRADIHYWLAFNSYTGSAKGGKRDLVLFNPQQGWQHGIEKIKYCVFHSKEFYNSVDIEHKYLIPTGFDKTLFKPRIKVGVAAVCHNGKGSTVLMELFKKADWSNFTFYICGPRWELLTPIYNNFVKLEYTHYLPYKEMPKFYQNLDYLLVPSSKELGESGPMVVVEALACGIPVISTDTGYAKDLDVTRFDNVDELVNILKGIEHKETDKVADYTWDNFRKKHVEVFEEMSGGGA